MPPAQALTGLVLQLCVLQTSRQPVLAWWLCLQAIFVMPTAFPVSSENLNYSGVAVGIVLFGSLAWWFFPVRTGRFAGARYWYTGEVLSLPT